VKRYMVAGDNGGTAWHTASGARAARERSGIEGRILCIDTDAMTMSVVPEPRLVCQHAATEEGPWKDYCNDNAQRTFDNHKCFSGRLTRKHARIVEKVGDEIIRVVETWSPPEVKPVTYKVQYFALASWSDDWTLDLGTALSRADADRMFDAGVKEFPKFCHRIIDSNGVVVREYEPPKPKPERWRVEAHSESPTSHWMVDKDKAISRARGDASSYEGYRAVRRESDGKVVATFRWVPGHVEEEEDEEERHE
jgi:hypothetical protein